MATHTRKSRPAISSLSGIVNPNYAIDNDLNTCATITKKSYSSVNTSVKNWANSLPDNTTINTIRLYHIGSGTSHSSGTIVTTKWNGRVKFSVHTSCAGIEPVFQSTNSTLATKDNTYTADSIMSKFIKKLSSGYTISGSILDWLRGNGSFTYDGTSYNSESMTFRVEMGSSNSLKEATANLYEIFFEINYTIPDYTIKAVSNNSEYGTATINDASSATIEYQSTGTLKAVPNYGYKFVKWSDGNTNATRTITVSGNKTYTATFEPISYSIKYVDNSGTSIVSAYFGREVSARAISDKNITITYNETSSRGDTEVYKLPVRGWKDSNSIVAKDGNTYTIDTFDAPFYANKYTDLYNAFGYNKYYLINHYVDYGINEGRQGKPNSGESCGVYLQGRTVASLSTTQGQEIVLEAVYEDSVLVTIGDISKSGYIFKGWQSPEHTELLQPGTQVYFTNSATLTAVWEQIPTYYLDLNGMLDGVSSGGISPYGTADVYINGELVSDDCSDFWTAYPVGTTYEIKDIKANEGYQYDGVYSGSLSGTISTETVYVVLSFSTVSSSNPPEFTSASLTYAGSQVSQNNKVPTGESCILSVAVS